MDEQTCAFVEFNDEDDSNSCQSKQSAPRLFHTSRLSCSKQSGVSVSRSHSHARSRVLSHNAEMYTDKDANECILHANAPPTYTGGFNGKCCVRN